ncbi:hypothetical protein ACFV4M_29595 [Kitasatospora indigofera]|uniref:hypothetical protein n=1 Tax=Kitasatospora indigofera TaxID=67307 RepID=UPI0036513B8B
MSGRLTGRTLGRPTGLSRRAVRLALVTAGAAVALAGPATAAFADGTPTPSVSVPASPSAGAGSGAAPAPAAPASPRVAGGTGATASPAPVPAPAAGDRGAGAPQVTTVPRGGAQTGEAETGRSTVTVVAGSGLAVAGVVGIGFAVARRRAGAQG